MGKILLREFYRDNTAIYIYCLRHSEKNMLLLFSILIAVTSVGKSFRLCTILDTFIFRLNKKPFISLLNVDVGHNSSTETYWPYLRD